MADTPLHEHEAVKHLMGTEHWPKQLAWSEREGWVHHSDRLHPSSPTITDLITLAAVRAMNATGWEGPRAVWFGPYQAGGFCCEYLLICGNEEYDERHVLGPTEPLAILAAYRATVMGKESSK